MKRTDNPSLFRAMEEHLLTDEEPSLYFKSLDGGLLSPETPFRVLGRLKETEQSPVYHPEGSVWNHTMLVVDEAAKRKEQSGDMRVFMWAALLHDIGKPDATRIRKGKITSYDHEKLGAEMAKRFLSLFENDETFIKKVAALIRWHMQILHVVKSPSHADIETMKEQAVVSDVALLGLCDRLGRLHADKTEEEKSIRLFLEKCGEKQSENNILP